MIMFYTPTQNVQRPTHERMHVRDGRDAYAVFEAVRQGVLPMVERRLNEIERAMFIKSGSVFVWEESTDDLGLRRWTDSREWGQSRMREPFLFYDEKVDAGKSSTDSSSHPDGSSTRLVKQACSVWVQDSPNVRPRKWHLTAYFSNVDVHTLPTPSRDPQLSGITAPPGVYRSGRARSRNTIGVTNPAPIAVAPGLSSSSLCSTPRSSTAPSPASSSSGSGLSIRTHLDHSYAPRRPHSPVASSHTSSPGSTFTPSPFTSPRASPVRYQQPPSPWHQESARLPPLESMSLSHRSYSRREPDARRSEDERMIQMLNSRSLQYSKT